MKTKSYSEMIQHSTHEERVEYLMLHGSVGQDTFGFDRYMNQAFYKSREWKDTRRHIILRDEGCDLGLRDYEIFGRILIHHINPISPKDIIHSSDLLLDPENLVCVSHDTHNLIHFGYSSSIIPPYQERRRGDTKLW